MKKFLCSILWFVVPTYVILAIGDYLFSSKAIESNLFHIESWYDLVQGKIDADIIVMGNSRAFVHVDPIILDSILGKSAYNLAFDGSSINRQIEKYNIFRKYNRKPELIIQNIDYITLVSMVGYEREQFFPYFWNKIMQKEIISSEPFTIWEKYVPLFRYYRNLDRHDIKGLLTSTARRQVKGYQGKDKQWDGTEFRKIEIARYAETEKAIKLFDEYLAKAREEGIKIIFVYTPIYIGVTQKLDHPEKMHARYQEFADRYNIPILDYSDMEICNDTTYFYNAMHLNKLGAEIFSDSLANDIKRLEEDGLLK